MKKTFSLVLFAFLVLNLMTISYGQKPGGKITIEGKVVAIIDGKSSPVANAVILLDGKNTGTITDSEGFYKIKVKKGIRKIGVFANSEILEEAIDNRNNINFTYTNLVPYQKTGNIEADEETVSIGYQKVKKNNLTGPVDRIDEGKLKNAHYDNIYEMIRGKVPGVSVNGNSIVIRSAVSTQGTEPLFVVDGIPVNSIGEIDPQMVRSIELLKGSAASIYGTRGSNGVILINLKKGNDR